jgi:hypothetical protein
VSMIHGIPVHFVEQGSGTPVLALHGVGVDHREMAGSAVLDGAGHGLPHEQVGLFIALLGEWLDRVREQHAAQH